MILVLEPELQLSAKRFSDTDLHNQLYILLDCWQLRSQPQGRNIFRMPTVDLNDLNAIAYHYLMEWQTRNTRFATSALMHPIAEVLTPSAARSHTRATDFSDYYAHHRGFARYLGELDRLKRRARLHIGKHGSIAEFLANYGVSVCGREGRGYSSVSRINECHDNLNVRGIPRLVNHYDQFYDNARLYNSYSGPGL